MFIFLLIYILGIIATLWISYCSLGSGTKITLFDLVMVIPMSLFSWIAFIVTVTIIYGDIRPATKEERQVLFDEMNLLGWTWNSKTKELNKLEKDEKL